ncbi:MAG: SH3 domain-containing protein, partial [Planctomycetota bacterium]|nr:SH3 domain-containing protein [Planctomycetota bacterium]
EPGDFVHTVLNETYLQPAKVEVGRDPDGRSYRVFRYTRSFLPTRAGLRRLNAPVLKFSVETGRRTGGFGLFSSPEVREYLAYGEPIELEVRPLPSEGRPDPYYGGVGRFTIAASLSKGRVKVGESLKLRVTIAGRGNTDYLQVPELGDTPGFHQLGKNTNRKPGEVVVTYDLMPTMASVSEVPSLRWNFFDTTEGVEDYVEIETGPLSLEVLPIAGAAALAALPGEAKKAVELGVDDIFDLRLASAAKPTALPPRSSAEVLWLVCLAPWIVSLFGSVLVRSRRRSLADVSGRRSRGARRRFDTALSADQDPLDAFVAYLADRLNCEAAAIIEPDLDRRLADAGFDAEQCERVRQVVESGVAGRYSGGGDAGVEPSQVQSLVQVLEATSSRMAPLASALMKCLLVSTGLLCSGVDLPAQQSQRLSKGEAAYRARDYAAAATEFAAAAAAGDRIAAYNLGNTRYRQGRFALALVAYERARLAMPRDAELLANIRLVRKQLDLASGEEAFGQTLASIRDSMTAAERLWVCVLINAAAALLICFGGRRRRLIAALMTVLAVAAIVEVAVLGPGRPPKGIVLDSEVAMHSEPDASLEARMKMRAGVTVEVLGSGSGWTKIRAEGLTGYVKSDSVAVVD